MDSPATAPEYVRVKTIAQRFGVSVSTIYRLIERKGLRATRIGRAVCVPADAVRELETNELERD